MRNFKCLPFTAISGICSSVSGFRKPSNTLSVVGVRGGRNGAYGRVSTTEYLLTPHQIKCFHEDGCVTLENVLTEDEVDAIEIVFDKFLSGEIPVPGKDFCDMSKPFGVPPEEWSIVNCMLPTKYFPAWRENICEHITKNIAKQLFDQQMSKDYDQLLSKRPGKTDAIFPWHQDMAYWPGPSVLGSKDTSTVTCSLAVDDSNEENGCLRYIVGSGRRKELREHRPLVGNSRDEGHALTLDVDDVKEEIRLAPAKRGSITLHDEYVVHGSGGNKSGNHRRTYVIAYRTRGTVDAERKLGFTHSHNDESNWDTFQNEN